MKQDFPFPVMVLDFETAWDKKEYTLSKMTTEQYIRDLRFKAWGAAYKYLHEEGEPVWIPAFKLKDFFAGIDWKNTAVLAHNAQFDVAILSWVYGHVPGFIFDSLSMARALRGIEVGNSLAKLARLLITAARTVQKAQGVICDKRWHCRRHWLHRC